MKFIIAFVTLFVLVLAAPRSEDATASKSEFDVGLESFPYAYKGSDGVEVGASAIWKNVSSEIDRLDAKGAFSVVNADGRTFSVVYVKDEEKSKEDEKEEEDI